MKEIWTQNLKKAFIWLSGYISFIAFAIVGGYTIIKSDDKELQKTSKLAFIITLIFTAITGFLLIYNNFASMATGYYSSVAYRFYSITLSITEIAKIIVFAVFIILSLIPNKNEKVNVENEEKN